MLWFIQSQYSLCTFSGPVGTDWLEKAWMLWKFAHFCHLGQCAFIKPGHSMWQKWRPYLVWENFTSSDQVDGAWADGCSWLKDRKEETSLDIKELISWWTERSGGEILADSYLLKTEKTKIPSKDPPLAQERMRLLISSLSQCSDLFWCVISKAGEKRMPLLCLSKNQNIEETESFPFWLVVLLLVRSGTPDKTVWGKASYTNLCLILPANEVFQTDPGVFAKTVNFAFPQCSWIKTNAVLIFLALYKKIILNTFGFVISLDPRHKFLHDWNSPPWFFFSLMVTSHREVCQKSCKI